MVELKILWPNLYTLKKKIEFFSKHDQLDLADFASGLPMYATLNVSS